MVKITNIEDDFLKSVCETSAISAMDLLEKFELNSPGWLLHTSGLSFGIWISICDPDEIKLAEIDNLIQEIVLSKLS